MADPQAPSVRRVIFITPTKKQRNPLVFTKPITKRVEDFVRSQGKLKRIIFAVRPNGTLDLRLEHTRKWESVLLTDIYTMAVKRRVASERAAKAARKKC